MKKPNADHVIVFILFIVAFLVLLTSSGCLLTSDASQTPIPVPYDIGGSQPQ
jgi:hypothetical protein